MPRMRKRTKRRRTGYTEEHLEYLLWGNKAVSHILAFSRTTESERRQKRAAMRKAWPILRERVFERLAEVNRSRGRNKCPTFRPWAWWEFESPEPRDPTTPEGEQLACMECVLTDDELREYNAWIDARRKRKAKRKKRPAPQPKVIAPEPIPEPAAVEPEPEPEPAPEPPAKEEEPAREEVPSLDDGWNLFFDFGEEDEPERPRGPSSFARRTMEGTVNAS